MLTDLPYSLTVDGQQKEINCDFRDIILILNAFNDPELTPQEKTMIMLTNLYVDDWTSFKDVNEAVTQAVKFIDWGKEYSEKENSPRIMDWEQDYNLIISAVNTKISVIDIRELDFVHWWTFLGYFSERGECQFSTFTEIRDNLNKGRPLERWQKETLRNNRDQIILKHKSAEKFENELWGE